MLPVFMRIVGSVVYHARLVPSTCEFRTAQLVQGARVGTTLVFPCWHQLIYLARYDDSINLLHAPNLLSCDTGNRGREPYPLLTNYGRGLHNDVRYIPPCTSNLLFWLLDSLGSVSHTPSAPGQAGRGGLVLVSSLFVQFISVGGEPFNCLYASLYRGLIP